MTQGRAITMDGFLTEWLKPGGVGFGIGALVAWFIKFRASRDDAKQARLDRSFSAYTKKMEDRCKDLEQRCDKYEGALSKMREDLTECEQRHLASDRKIMEMEAMIQAAGLARQMAQQTIAAEKKKDREE